MDESMSNEHSADEAETVTLSDVVQTEQDLFADACAVLGASDDKNCTYGEGYLKRQALYACLTCIPEARYDVAKRAGVCLACTFHCHDGHELIELYTKRAFRCDCGNSKFPGYDCNLNNEKDSINEMNVYNQNFSGLYCVCSRPYPDPEDSVTDEMIQCIICEDWYHSRHLGIEPPVNFAEMICENCVKKHNFLLYYDGLTITKVTNDPNDDTVDVGGDKGDEISTSELLNKLLNERTDVNKKDAKDLNFSKEGGNNSKSCKKPLVKSDQICAKFMKDISWRQQLCTCEDCLSLYVKEKVAFLVDLQDTVQVYEERGKALYMENEMNAINSLDRVPLMEAIAGYNDMKGHLVEYLKKFADNKKVVREEDIREFFSSMNARKKQRTTIPYLCR